MILLALAACRTSPADPARPRETHHVSGDGHDATDEAREQAVVKVARERRPSLRIGVVTGWEGHNAPSEGADFLLRKPIRTSDFSAEARAMERVLR